jgi:hypothetical protein
MELLHCHGQGTLRSTLFPRSTSASERLRLSPRVRKLPQIRALSLVKSFFRRRESVSDSRPSDNFLPLPNFAD